MEFVDLIQVAKQDVSISSKRVGYQMLKIWIVQLPQVTLKVILTTLQ